MSKLKDIKIIDDVLKEVDLLDRKKDKVGGYSQGMKQRLGIAQALMHQPSLIILDEPSNGLDPQGRADMRELILKINKERAITVVISSHILAEIEKISNRMIVINKGKKIAEGEVNQLMSSDSIKIQIKTDSHASIKNYCIKNKIPFTNENESYYLQWEEAKINELIKSLNNENISLYEVRQLKTLEEYFLNLTN